MAVPTWVPGQVLAAADVNNWFVPLVAYKTSNQSVTSSTTLVNDNALSLAVAANAVYRMELGMTYTADTAGDIKIAWTTPASSTIAQAVCMGLSTTAATSSDDFTVGASSAPPFGGIGAGSPAATLYIFIFTTAGTAGTLQLQWAQNTSSATATTVQTGSYLIGQRVG